MTRNRAGAASPNRTRDESGALRQRILDAALDIVEADGIQALTQPKVAKAAGIRQSHITYYFPRKADLVVGLLKASHRRADLKPRRRGASPLAKITGVILDSVRMEFFLGNLLYASGDPELRAILREHADHFAQQVGDVVGRPKDDPALLAFIDELRGAGLRGLMSDDRWPDLDVDAVAMRHGLVGHPVPAPGRASRSRAPRSRGASS